MNYILPISFIVLPFAFLSPGTIHIGQHYALLITALILMGSWFYTGQTIKFKNKFLSLFVLYFCCQAVLTLILSWSNTTTQQQLGITLYTVFYFTSGGIVLLSAATSKLSKKEIYTFIRISVIVQSVIAVFQMAGFDPVFWVLGKFINVTWAGFRENMPRGTLGNQDFLLAYIAISLPLFYRKKWAFFLILLVPVLFIAKVSTAIITAAVATCVYFGKNVRWILSVTAPCLVVLIVYIFLIDKIPLKNARFDMWGTALSELDSWVLILFGYGPGSTQAGVNTLHCDWLSIIYTYGIIGFFLVFGFVYQTIHKFYFYGILNGDRMLVSCLSGATVNCLGNPALEQAPTLFLILILFGLAHKKAITNEPYPYDSFK